MSGQISGTPAGADNLVVRSTPAPGVLLVRLNRPSKRNALTVPLLAQLADSLEGADQDEGIGAVVITGDAKAFSAGSDIGEQHRHGVGHVFSEARLSHWKRIERAKKPTIAAVNGYAFGGGCELMMLFDFAIAGDDAVFAMPETGLGVFPGDGGTQRLPRAIGAGAAKRMILTGERVDAGKALALGLVTEVVPSGQAIDRAVEVAAGIASKNRLAVAMAMDAIDRGIRLSLEEGLELEQRNLAKVFEEDGWKEGMAAFVEKTLPVREPR
ncbi:MAG: enoyl-CoA hydratase/isomerase family protein [Parvibaculaceae bacterium]